MCKKICVSLLFILCSLTVLSCCQMPTYNLSDGGTPSQALSEFLDAVIRGDNASIKDMVYNFSWNSDYLTDSSVSDSDISPSDAEIISCISKSRKYEIVSESNYDPNGHNAEVTVNYTTFNVTEFEQKLAEKAVAIIQRRQYEGEVFKDASDTVKIIEETKLQLLKNPEIFYTTQKYTVEMVSYKGKWRVVLSDEFYKALSGYSI
ncbi:MAG: hypothetical protein ACI4IJ_05545 [Acutalibacteraceae bacterium]